MKRAVVAPALVLGLLLSCGGPFPSGISFDETCDGVRCPAGSRCIENLRSNGEPYAACAIGGASDPECERDFDRTYCDGNTWIACKGRYRTRAEGCGSDFCVEFGANAKCVPSRDPDPGCAENDTGGLDFTFCRGNALVGCIGPWARVPQDCEARFCRGVAGEAQCRLQAEPDPRCKERAPGDTRFCDGDVAVSCDGEWREFEDDCAQIGRRCHEVLQMGDGKVPYASCESP